MNYDAIPNVIYTYPEVDATVLLLFFVRCRLLDRDASHARVEFEPEEIGGWRSCLG